MIATFARLLDAHCPRGGSNAEIGVEDGALWPALADGGWLLVGAAEQAGGSGLDLFDLALLAIEWGRRLAPLPFATTVLARRWGVLTDESAVARATFALPTPDGTATPFADGVSPDGLARSLPLARAAGRSDLSRERFSEAALLFAAEALGAAHEIFERAIAYSQERIAYGSPISGFQAMRHLMADMFTDLELGKSALFWAVNVDDAERMRALYTCVDRSRRVAEGAMQVFGGIGYTWELGAHLYLRHILAAQEVVGWPLPAEPSAVGLAA